MLQHFLLKFARKVVRTAFQRRTMCVSGCHREMAAFDFDMTIIDEDSDMAVSQLLPSSDQTAELLALVPKCGWIVFIRQVLQMLYKQHCTDAASVGRHVRTLPPVPGMLRLLRQLAKRHTQMDLFIISDSNCFFISEWLKAHGIDNLFTGIYTNPASIAADGQLFVSPYEDQQHCVFCPDNLCKGGILDKLISMGNYKRVLYIGDGCNDLCPISHLRADDIACIRRGHELHDKLAHHRHQLTCNRILSWRNGHDLYEQLPKGDY